MEVINLYFNTNQINNLCTGVRLAAELKPSKSNLRKFLTVHGYSYSNEEKKVRPGKFLKQSILDNIYFQLHCYEISIKYYNNNWDVVEDNLESEIYLDDIKGIEALEIELKNYVEDFSILKPEWHCDNLL